MAVRLVFRRAGNRRYVQPVSDGRPSGGQRLPPGAGASAGATLLSVLALCTGAGYGIGRLIGYPITVTLAGFIVGLAAAVAVVYWRYRDL